MDANAKADSLRDWLEREFSLSRSIRQQSILEHAFHAKQFAAVLTMNPPRWTFDELAEEYKPLMLQRGNVVLCIFQDQSCLEFTQGSALIQPHPPADLETVLTRVSNRKGVLML